jgi:hypothetical protein
MADLTTSALPTGADTFTASYSGDSNYVVSVSSEVTATVNPAETSTQVYSSQNPSLTGQPVTFTATVTAVAPGGGTPTGLVLFTDGLLPLATQPVVGGIAAFTTSSLSAGSHTITASYLGDLNFAPSSGTGTPQEVTPASATVSLDAKPSEVTLGQSITLTATVIGTPLPPTGTVDFLDGTTLLAAGVKLDPGGQATFTVALPPTGIHTYVANYSGDTNYDPATGSTTATVKKATVAIEVRSSANPSVCGQPITLSATLTPPVGGPLPTGIVHFLDDGKEIGQALAAAGVATLSVNLATGAHPITVHYDGDDNYEPGDGALSGNPQVVQRGDTCLALTTSQNPCAARHAVTFTAVVCPLAPAAGIPTGTVAFFDGRTPLASVPLTAGIATWTASDLAVGSHDITAQYSGDSNFNESAATLTGGPQVVEPLATEVHLAAEPDKACYGTSITLEATVRPSNGEGTPGRTVIFRDGSRTLATVALDEGAASCRIELPGPGVHTYFAEYSGDAQFGPATGSKTVNIDRARVQATISSSSNPATAGQSFTLNAAVSFAGTPPSGLATPSGRVTFHDGSTTLGTATLDSTGSGTLSTSSTISGDHAIYVTYEGDSLYESGSSTVLTETITAAPMTVTVNAANGVLENGRATYTISISSLGGFDSDVVFTCTGLPAGLSCRFDPATVPAGPGPLTTTLTVSAGSNAAVPFTVGIAALLLALALGLRLTPRPVTRFACSLALVTTLVAASLAGCGGGSGGSTAGGTAASGAATTPAATAPASPSTGGGQGESTAITGFPSGTYPFTVTATSGSKSVSQQLTVSVP